MKVDKEKFDALLGRLMQARPQEGKAIKGEPGNVQPIIPAAPSPRAPPLARREQRAPRPFRVVAAATEGWETTNLDPPGHRPFGSRTDSLQARQPRTNLFCI